MAFDNKRLDSFRKFLSSDDTYAFGKTEDEKDIVYKAMDYLPQLGVYLASGPAKNPKYAANSAQIISNLFLLQEAFHSCLSAVSIADVDKDKVRMLNNAGLILNNASTLLSDGARQFESAELETKVRNLSILKRRIEKELGIQRGPSEL